MTPRRVPTGRPSLRETVAGHPPHDAKARLSFRAGQTIAIERLENIARLQLHVGCLTMDVEAPDIGRKSALILYPGDVFGRDLALAMPRSTLTALVPSIMERVPDLDADASSGGTLARLTARLALHAVTIAHLTVEQRLATLLIEIATNLGTPTADGYVVELPLTRAQMAQYLAINPDTLSRSMTSFKSRGLIVLPTRQRAILKCFDKLLELTPLAHAVVETCGLRPGGAVPDGKR